MSAHIESLGLSISKFITKNRKYDYYESATAGFDGSYLQNDIEKKYDAVSPILSQLDAFNIERVSRTGIKPGDVMVHYFGRWRVSYATEEYFFGNPLVVEDIQNPVWNPYIGSHSYRIASNIHFELPQRKLTPPELFTTEESPFMSDLSDANFGEILVNHQDEYKDRRSTLRQIFSLKEIEYEVGDDAVLKNDYLYITKSGMPMIISDFHQKIPYAVFELIHLGYIPNSIPVIDWIDEHGDGDDTRNNLYWKNKSSLQNVVDLKEIIRISDCGQAASLLDRLELADMRFFDNFSWVPKPSWGASINPYSYVYPFARTNSRPHILSFETDHASGLYGQLFFDQRSSVVNFNDTYFTWLKEHGLTKDNYDAVLIFTGAPDYCIKKQAKNYTERLVNLFE